MDLYNKHYIKVDERGLVIALWSDGPSPEVDTRAAICINEKGSYQAYLTIHGEKTKMNPNLFTVDGIPRYQWVDGEVIRRPVADIDNDRPAPDDSPTEMEQLKANVDFMMAMFGMNAEGGNHLASAE